VAAGYLNWLIVICIVGVAISQLVGVVLFFAWAGHALIEWLERRRRSPDTGR
jgi:hypothetical protein